MVGMPTGAVGRGTGTIWDNVYPTQPNYPGAVIPRSFELRLANGERIWISGNASEHLAEYARATAANMLPGTVRLATQQQLESLQSVLHTAMQNGVPYNQLIRIGRWEIKIAPPRRPGQLPSVIHALMR